MKPRLLDLFCGAGGCAVGYHRADFDVVGVDSRPQKHYPFEFHQEDALEYVIEHAHEFDIIHASPPCQAYSATRAMENTAAHRGESPTLIEPVRTLLIASGKPYVIENVMGAPLCNPIMLCGLSFGLNVFRHRLFESNIFLMQPPHQKHGDRRIGVGGFCCVAGHGDANRGRIPADHRNKASWEAAMGINWMTQAEMAQAIPPAYTEFIGRQLYDHITQETNE